MYLMIGIMPSQLSSLANWPRCFRSIHMFMSSALTSQRLLTLYGTLVLYTNCCSSPYPAPFTIGLFITYLVVAIAQNFSLPFSGLLIINASMIPGYIYRTCIEYIQFQSDLVPCCPGNRFNKYADDTYILVPPSNYNTITIELENISQWPITWN